MVGYKTTVTCFQLFALNLIRDLFCTVSTFSLYTAHAIKYIIHTNSSVTNSMIAQCTG